MPPSRVVVTINSASDPLAFSDAGTNLLARATIFSSAKCKVVSVKRPIPQVTTRILPPPTANQKRKARVVVPEPTTEHLSSSMTPSNVTIVTRCLARITPPSPPSSKKRSSHQTPTVSPSPSGPHVLNPYSRAFDLANTRSTVPSPQELARAERAEEEKARQKKENAAAARAAAALARRRKALRSGRGSRTPSASVQPTPASMIPPIQRAVAKERARSAEAAAAQLHLAEERVLALGTAEPEDGVLPPPRTLKRTRSSGLINVVTGNGVAAGSPLKSVINGDTAASPDSTIDAPIRKRSRLAESLPTRAPSTRRTSTSPIGSTTSLPEGTGAASPRKPATLSPTDTTSTAMRRVVSSNDTPSSKRAPVPRTGSVGPDANARERSRRETQLPARMRDYQA